MKNYVNAPVPLNWNEPVARLPMLASTSALVHIACPLSDVVPSVKAIEYDVLTCRALVFMAEVLITSHEHAIDHSLRPARKAFHDPVDGDAISIVSQPLLSLQDFRAAIFVPPSVMYILLPSIAIQ